MDYVGVPLTDSPDEWGNDLLELASLVVDGFSARAIRTRLEENQLSFNKEKKDKSLYLLEVFLASDHMSGQQAKLSGLREVQRIRTKVKAHWGGQEANELKQRALSEHQTFTTHFENLCTRVAEELERIEKAFS